MAIVISGTTGIDAGSLPVANTGKISAGAGLPAILNTAGVDRVTVDTAGNVGIGTSSPSAKLDVALPAMTSASSNNVIVIRSPADGVNNSLNGTLGICFNARYQYITPEHSGAGIYAINTDNNAYGRSLGLLFKTSTQDSIATEKMRIDSNGYVTTPNQPAFQAQAVSSDTIYGLGYVPYPNIIFNNGNHYNTSTSTFTAPVAGIYLFHWSTWHNVATTGRTYLYKNGSVYKSSGTVNGMHVRLSSSDSNAYGSAQMLVQLNVNDTVQIYNGEGDISLFYANGFSGYLIG